MSETYYKFLSNEGASVFDCERLLQWSLPVNGCLGNWAEIDGDIKEFRTGIHACSASDLSAWMGDQLYTLEFDGDVVRGENHVVVGHRARLVSRIDAWNDRNARLFAVDCTERVIGSVDKFKNSPVESSDALAIARRFSDGQETAIELYGAHRRSADAYCAIRSSWCALEALSRATQNSAPWEAARSAVDSACYAGDDIGTDWQTTIDAERKWQNDALLKRLGLA